MEETRESAGVAIAHDSASYRRGLAAAFVQAGFRVDDHQACGRSGRHLLATSGDTSVVVDLVAGLDPEAYRLRFLEGANAVVDADSEPELIVDVTRRALAGETVLPTELARRLITGRVDEHLTDGEIALLRGLAAGTPLARLTDDLHASERTLRRRLQAACVKLGVPDRAAAVRVASERGLLGA